MNDESDNPLTPVGDDALEARIVAWVLGEASSFEAAELEKLCAGDPVLGIFAERMRVLHGLLAADAKSAPDAEWKLPEAKRAKITDLLGVDEEEPVTVQRANRYFARRSFLAAAACLMLSLVAYTVFGPGFFRKQYLPASPNRHVDFMPGAATSPSEAQLKAAAIKAAREREDLSRAILQQEDAVDDKRKLLSRIIRQEGVVHSGDQSVFQGSHGFDEADDAESAARAYMNLEQEKLQLSSQIEALAKYNGPQTGNYASGLDLPDDLIKTLVPQYQQAKRELEGLKSSGVGTNHPEMAAKAREVESKEQELGEATANLKETLKAQLALANEQETRLEARMDKNKAGAIEKGIAGESFVDAKKDFEAAQQQLEKLKAKRLAQEIESKSGESAIALNSPAAATNFESGNSGQLVPVPGAMPASGVSLKPSETDFSAAKKEPEIAAAVTGALPELAESQSKLAGGAGGRGRGVPPNGQTRTNDDFIGTADGVDLPGAPAAPGTNVTDIVTAGNRSGDGAINRNNIDAVLNNPNRAITGPVEPMGRSSGGVPAASKPAQQQFFDAENALAKKSTELASEGKLGKGMKQEEEVRYKVDSQDAPAVAASPAPVDAFASAKDSAGSADPFASEKPAIETASRRPRPEVALRLGLETAPSKEAAAIAGKSESGAEHFFGLRDSVSPAENEQLLEYRSSSSDEATKSMTGDRFAWSVRDEATKSPAFDSLKDMGALAEDLKSMPPPVAMLGGVLRNEAQQPSIAQGHMDLDSLSSLDRRQGVVGQQTFLAGGSFNTNTADANLWTDKIKEAKGDSIADPGQRADTDDLRRKLYIAEGNYNLGKYDEASKAYEDAIRLDPYNKAARHGMEVVEKAKQDYYRAAYDQTRAELLTQVDKDWELKVPEGETAVGEKAQQQEAAGRATASNLAQQEMSRRQNAIGQADGLREAGRKDYAEGNYAGAYAKQAEAIQLLPDADMTKDRKADLSKQLAESAAAQAESERSKGDEAKSRDWAGKALQWDSSNTRAKAILKLAPGDETSATAEPFSTFSLHVSDASFKLAKAAMDRGEQPDPAGIRPEEFYNAFDYGDPAPGRGEPVACALEQAAHPAVPQRNLLRIGVRTGSAGRGQSTPLNLTLLLDSSGSMEREDRHVGMTLAIQQLSSLLKEGDTISVVGFSRTPRLLADRLPGARAAELNALIAQTPSEGGTNLEEGLKIAGELAHRQFNPAAQNRVVLFTDGAANLGDAQPETLQAKVEAMRQQGIAFDAAGFGADGLNDRLLERLTRNGNGRYYVVDNAEDANANFSKQLAGAFRPAAENVKVQVRFNPARVGKYKLIGFEEHRLNKEDFHNDAVDAAEMAAEEAGNALYQVEALPGGEGEIGEVSVRFRDVASGQMVERTWTIPYEAQSPAFDQAAPSIQLAGLAAFTAEKLRHAPMADAIDFQQLRQTFAKVKARYQNSQAVSDLGTMIGRLK